MQASSALKPAATTGSAAQTLVASIATALDRLIFFALLTLLASASIFGGTTNPAFISVFEVTIFFLTAAWIVEGWLAGRWQLYGYQLLIPLLALIVYALMQTLALKSVQIEGLESPVHIFVSFDPYQTRLWVMQTTATILLGALLLRFTSDVKRLRLLAHLIIVMGVASAAFGILRHKLDLPLPGWADPFLPAEGFGFFANPNHFALFMEMTLGLTAGIVVASGVRRFHIPLYLAPAGLLWAGLVLSNSRGAIISMMGQFLALALLWLTTKNPAANLQERAAHSHEPENSRKTGCGLFRLIRALHARFLIQASLASALVGVVAYGTIWLGGDSLRRRIERSPRELNAETPSRENSQRLAIWRATLAMIKDNPITGVGFGAYSKGIPQYHDGSGGWVPEEAHNDYLELLASGGVIGLSFGVWFVAVFSRNVRRELHRTGKSADSFLRAARLGGLVGLTGVALHSLVDFGLHITVNAIVFTALIVIATTHIGVMRDRKAARVSA